MARPNLAVREERAAFRYHARRMNEPEA